MDDGLAVDVLDRLWLRCSAEGRTVEFSNWSQLVSELQVNLTATQLRRVVTKDLTGLARYLSPTQRRRGGDEHTKEHKIVVIEPAKDKIVRRLQVGSISVTLDGTQHDRLATLLGMPKRFVDVSLAELIIESRVVLTLMPGRKSYEKYELATDSE